MPVLRAVVLLAVSAIIGLAQFETAVVLGTVRDASQGIIGDAKVMLVNLETGITANAITDTNGNYLFNNVKVGRYKLSAEKPGFTTAAAEDFTVSVNARQRVDLTMTVGQVTESVQVSAAVVAVESDSTERGQVVSQRQIVELPLNGRNYADLSLLTTGVRRSDYAFANPPRDAAFNINGQRSVFNNFLLDGVDNNAYGTSNQGFSSQVVQPTPDALAEFKVVTMLPSAEYGRSSGGVINAAFKSGTNAIHGSAWEFLRNTSLNAVGFFKPATASPRCSATSSAPRWAVRSSENRAFFFADYEGFREITEVCFVLLDSLAGRPARAVSGGRAQSADRRGFSRQHGDPDVEDDGFRGQGSERTADSHRGGPRFQFQQSSARSQLQRQVRPETRRADQRPDDDVRAPQPAQEQLPAGAGFAGSFGKQWEWLYPGAQPGAGRGLHLQPVVDAIV